MRVGVVGGGIVGRLIAWQLQRAGMQVTLWDREVASCPENASFVAAGLLTPVTELARSEPQLFTLGQRALALWPAVLAALDSPVYCRLTGSLVLASRGDEAQLQRFMACVRDKLPFAPADATQSFVTPLNAAALQALEPALSKFHQGYYCQPEGVLDAQQVMHAIRAQFLQLGGVWHAEKTASYVGAHQVVVDGVTEFQDWVVDCRGLGARGQFSSLRPVRGEVIWLEAPEVELTRPIRLLHPRYGLYVVPRPNHRYVLGASEIEADDNSPISVRTTLELLTAAASIHSGFLEARVLKTATQCRPTFPDALPRLHDAEGYVSANGLYRHGFLLAPLLAQVVADFLTTGQRVPSLDLWANEVV